MNRLILPLIIIINLAACTSTKPYQLGTVGEDGLAAVTNATLDEVAIRPDRQFSQYKKVIIKPISISYAKQRRGYDALNRGPEDFQLDEKELEIFNRQYVKAFKSQWAESLGWEVTEQPGSDVVILRAEITDFYLFASIKNNTVLPNQTFANETSKMVLNLELVDSQSGEVLLRSKDKKTTGWVNSTLSTFRPVNSVRYWSDAYQAFRQWATSLSPYLG